MNPWLGTLSPDGRYRWDGMAWQPVTTPTPAPAAKAKPSGREMISSCGCLIFVIGAVLALVGLALTAFHQTQS
jgi:hypothetical protein